LYNIYMKFLLKCSCVLCKIETTVQSLKAHILKHGPKKSRPCIRCGEPISRWGSRFCSLSCSAIYNNKIRPRKIIRNPRVYAETISRKRTEWIEKWLRGEVPMEETYSGMNNIPCAYIRRFLILRYGEKCHKCGWAERNKTTGKIPVQFNHIDGD